MEKNLDIIERSELDIPLSDVKRGDIPTVSHESTTEEAIRLMQESRQGAMAVLKGKVAVGLISERDLILKPDFSDPEWAKRPISDFMTAGPFSLPETSLLSDAIKLVTKRSFRQIPLTNETGEYVSMVSIKDMLGHLVEYFPRQVGNFGVIKSWENQTVDDYSEMYSTELNGDGHLNGNIFMAHLKRVSHRRPAIVDESVSIGEVIDLIRFQKGGAVLLTRYETQLLGIITERDILLKAFKEGKVDPNLKATDFMSANPDTLLRKHYIAHAINNMFHFNYRNTIVVDEDNYPLSVIGMLELFKFVAYHFYGDEVSLL